MAHPLVPQILDLARPVAARLGLDLVGASLHTNQSPTVLRVDIRHPSEDTSLEDCERFSRALETCLDASEVMSGGAYTLEVSSPGLSDELVGDREFAAFKGFPVEVTTHSPYKGKTHWQGNLTGRDETAVKIAQKGRAIAIPRDLVQRVKLSDAADP